MNKIIKNILIGIIVLSLLCGIIYIIPFIFYKKNTQEQIQLGKELDYILGYSDSY